MSNCYNKYCLFVVSVTSFRIDPYLIFKIYSLPYLALKPSVSIDLLHFTSLTTSISLNMPLHPLIPIVIKSALSFLPHIFIFLSVISLFLLSVLYIFHLMPSSWGLISDLVTVSFLNCRVNTITSPQSGVWWFFLLVISFP